MITINYITYIFTEHEAHPIWMRLRAQCVKEGAPKMVHNRQDVVAWLVHAEC
jgi:hypothetical protein